MGPDNMTINPKKFTIFDSDMSDSEADGDEWVSISSSNTISTTSTLPSHLNLNPKSTVKTSPQPSNNGKTAKNDISKGSAPVPPPPPPPPSKTDIPPYKPTCSPHPFLTNTRSTSPTALLKSSISNLSAIYIVSPTSITNVTQYSYTSTTRNPFAYLSAHCRTPPISAQATRHSDTLHETYIRVCADCAKPRTTIYCDGTWTLASPTTHGETSTCRIHATVLQGLNISESALNLGWLNKDGDPQYCPHASADLYRCGDCNLQRDRALFRAVLRAVEPFRRVETTRAGIKVFDMSVPVAVEVYKHVEGCGCER